MIRLRWLLLVPLVLLVCLPLVSGTVICFQMEPTGTTGNVNLYGAYSVTTANAGYAQVFKTNFDGANVTSVKFLLMRSGIITGGVLKAHILGVSGTYGTNSIPNATEFALSDAVTADTLSASETVVEFTFSTPYALVAGQQYACALGFSTAGDSGAAKYVAVGRYINLLLSDQSMGNYCATGAGGWTATANNRLGVLVFGSDSGVSVVYGGGDTNYYYATNVTETVFNNTAVSATGGVNVESISNAFNNTAVSASGELSIADATLTINETPTLLVVVIFAIINIVLLVFPRIPILNIVFALMTIGLVATSFATTFKDLPFHPYLALLEILLAVLSLLACALRLRDT